MIKTARAQLNGEKQSWVAEARRRRDAQLPPTWQWLGKEQLRDVSGVATASLWHDFCPRDGEQIERAYVGGAQAAELADPAFLADDGGGKLVVRLRADEARRRWAEHVDGSQPRKWQVRRVRRVLAPQNGGVSPARERAIDETRRVAQAVLGQRQEEADVDEAARLRVTREERERRARDQTQHKQRLVESVAAKRAETAAEKEKRARHSKRWAKEAERVTDQRRDDIKRERTERAKRRELLIEDRERVLENRRKEQLAARKGNDLLIGVDFREELDRRRNESRQASVRLHREQQREHDQWLREEAGLVGSPKVQLTRGQWHVRQDRLDHCSLVKSVADDLKRQLHDDMERELRERCESRMMVREDMLRRREKGIAAGGAGLGSRSGGLVHVSSFNLPLRSGEVLHVSHESRLGSPRSPPRRDADD